ncbi:RbsD/FucU domain-containing protein [Zobellia alginiliquefaciens]|uniref:RbsD/FucU domain-containing protein n=1 Tax=Zobellia alginiliquefaciens TaxID=3032586 RepID=UPI0023E3D76B|nr:RbsD/FucU domain-containing protein [Zobellia alginiliquefaciens]
MKKYIVLSLMLCLVVGCVDTNPNSPKLESIRENGSTWEDVLQGQIKFLGHRNWIVVVDEAYPLQSSPGITMVRSTSGHVQTLETVKKVLDRQGHIKPIVYLDKEIDYIDENMAKGITEYRESLKDVIGANEAKKIIHEDIIGMLDRASKQFNILVVKTDFTIPYTSVFFELDCKYWNAESEKIMREKMEESSK